MHVLLHREDAVRTVAEYVHRVFDLVHQTPLLIVRSDDDRAQLIELEEYKYHVYHYSPYCQLPSLPPDLPESPHSLEWWVAPEHRGDPRRTNVGSNPD